MNIKFVDLKKQYLSIKKEIDISISKVINESAFIKGKYVKDFEKRYSEKYGIRHVISCANGTDAIYIALKSLGIRPGDEVITTALSWISTSETISQAGAKPVFVDIDPNYFTIDHRKIEEKITSNTKAIIPVHLYGHPASMGEIVKIAQKYNLKIIEDCAQSHFAMINDRKVGTFGDFATFSFFPGKNLGAYGDAGCIITDNEELAIKARMFANHGGLEKHSHEIEGINSRLDGIQASVLLTKLKYIDEWTSLRIKLARDYGNSISNKKISLPQTKENYRHVFHLYVLRTNNRDALKSKLESKGISTGIHYPKALPFLKAYKYLGHKLSDFPVSNRITKEILSIPIYPELTRKELDYVSNILNGR
tara:strand:+ start:4437 stop:5531 length:1095 start_codon:yes stop_codon:yes gene_type:complete